MLPWIKARTLLRAFCWKPFYPRPVEQLRCMARSGCGAFYAGDIGYIGTGAIGIRAAGCVWFDVPM